jgi:hypothetical protein
MSSSFRHQASQHQTLRMNGAGSWKPPEAWAAGTPGVKLIKHEAYGLMTSPEHIMTMERRDLNMPQTADMEQSVKRCCGRETAAASGCMKYETLTKPSTSNVGIGRAERSA